MTDNEILNIVNAQYPLAVGVILTGSTLKKRGQNIGLTDIDIVIIDPRFCIVSPLILTIQNTRFDFTQLPFFDLENVLFNEFFDPKGILITMIADGEIIKDTNYRITEKFKELAIKLRNRKQRVQSNEFRDLHRLLKNVRAECKKDLSLIERYFLVNNFVNLISSAEVNRSSGWLLNGKHKSTFISEHLPDFANELINLTNYPNGKPENKNIGEVANYLDRYLSTIKVDNDPNYGVKNRYVLDIIYSDISVDSLCNKIIPLIKGSFILKGHYLFFYKSEKKFHRIYKNCFSIVFSTKGISLLELKTSFSSLLKREIKSEVKFSSIPTVFFSNDNFNKDFSCKSEDLQIALNQFPNPIYVLR